MTAPLPTAPAEKPVLATEADRIEADMAIHRYKTNGGIQRYEQDRALRLQLNDKSGRFQ